MTPAQQVAHHLIPIVASHPARTVESKQLDLTSLELLRQIKDNEQVVVDAKEYEKFCAWRASEEESDHG